jgi:hypothetical protein
MEATSPGSLLACVQRHAPLAMEEREMPPTYLIGWAYQAKAR